MGFKIHNLCLYELNKTSQVKRQTASGSHYCSRDAAFLAGQRDRVCSPWRTREGGLGSEVNSSQAGQMERQSCGKQLEPTTAGLEPSASSTRSSKGALGLTQQVPSPMRQLPTLLLAQMSVLYGNSKIWPQSKWLLRAVCSQTLAGLHRGSGLGPLRTPKGSERQGLG